MGFISPTCLCPAFTCIDSKSIKIQSSHQYILALLGYARVKAARKMLMKLFHDVNQVSISSTFYVQIFQTKLVFLVTFWLRQKIHMKNSRV